MTFWTYDLNEIVKEDHDLKKISKIINLQSLVYRIKDLATELGRKGYGLEVGLKCLFLQFYYDLSDRELEDRLRYDIAFKWFCNFGIDDATPDHSYFGRVRSLIGTKRIGKIFQTINNKTKDAGILRPVFSFVDASAIKAKETTWEQRDKAIKEGEDKLNNDNIDKYSSDKDARFGCKGKSKFWYGYKKHVSVDMGSGLIKKVAVTPANVPDEQGLKNVCPDGGMVFGDKAYCLKPARKAMQANKCHSGAIMKNNMLGKNKDKDRWLSRVRAPFESVFSKQEKRARYRGIAKVQFQAFMESMVFNLKRLVTLNSPPLFGEA
jgi:IS5 family transposase